jgi:hypothetical protein
LSFLEKTIFFTLLFLALLAYWVVCMKFEDALMGYKTDSLGSLDAKDKYTLYLKKNWVWLIPSASMCIGLLTASLVSN